MLSDDLEQLCCGHGDSKFVYDIRLVLPHLPDEEDGLNLARWNQLG